MKLNLGCGQHSKKGYVNLDIAKLPGVDVVHNLDVYPYPFEDNHFDEIIAHHVIEHVTDLIQCMQELHRICKPGAKIFIRVPYYNSQAAAQDPTHKQFFTFTTFDYFTQETFFHYYGRGSFKIVKREGTPTRLGRIFPSFIRKPLSLILGEIIWELRVVLEVTK